MKRRSRQLGLVLTLALAVVVALLYRSDLPVEELKAEYTDAESRFFDFDGLSIHYKDEGPSLGSPGRERPLLLLHGTASSLHTWDGWVDELASDFRLLRPDLPGFALTGPDPARDYSAERRVEVLTAFLDHLEVSSCAVAGNSLGGYIAWQLAARRPERVDKLVLLDPAGYPQEGDMAILDLGRVPVLKSLLARLTPRFLVAAAVREAYADPSLASPEIIDRYYRLLLREGNRQALLDSLGREGADDPAATIRSLSQPTLVMWGREDQLIPVTLAERFHRDLPRSELIVYDDVGHMPMEEIPQRSARDAAAFLLRNEPVPAE